MNQDNLDSQYSTSDLALAAAISLVFPIESIDKQNPRKAVFLFSRNDKLTNFINQYWKGDLKIEPRAYFTQIKTIKSRLYSDS